MKRFKYFGLVAGVSLIADLATKALVMARFSPYETVTVIDGFFNLVNVRNRGAAFGIFSNAEELRLPLFIGVTALALLGILWMASRLGEKDRMEATGLALIFGGAVGNLVDRIRFGEVIDFLDFYVKSAHWPAFNVADIVICVGAGLVILSEFTTKKTAAN